MKKCDSFWLLLRCNNLSTHLTVYFNYLFIFSPPRLHHGKIQFYFSVIILIFHSRLFFRKYTHISCKVDCGAINSGRDHFISFYVQILILMIITPVIFTFARGLHAVGLRYVPISVA